VVVCFEAATATSAELVPQLEAVALDLATVAALKAAV
jgi:hypothetical protein